jgi:subtilisin family serine protease
MPRSIRLLIAATLMASAATAQIRLPSVSLPTLPLQGLQTSDPLQSSSLDRLSDVRHLALSRLIRANRQTIDTDPQGEPVIRSEILAMSPGDAALQGARARGFSIDREQLIESLNIHLVVLKAPPDMSTKKALRSLRDADPGGSYDYNHVYSGGGAVSATPAAAIETPEPPAQPTSDSPVRVGLLDTGIDVTHPVFSASSVHAWGCDNHPVPAAHGTAVASLLVGGSGIFQGAEPGAELYAADVYCGRPTGGAVDALVAALAWLVQEKVPVINVSLVGPKNALLERVIGELIRSGYIIVAAVGNDGPAAPALYPASYPNVVGVTAVDAHNRVLLEAAHGPQVMFAAPGADLAAAGGEHTYASVRGTSFAAPLVAGLLAAHLAKPDAAAAASAIDAVKLTAVDLGAPGRDLTYGFGLVGASLRIDPGALIRK